MVSTRASSGRAAKYSKPSSDTTPGAAKATPIRNHSERSGRGTVYQNNAGSKNSSSRKMTAGVRKRRGGASPSSNSISTTGVTNFTSKPPKRATTKSTSITAYSPKFLQHLANHSIYYDGYEDISGSPPARPSNWDEMLDRVTRTRRSLSPTKFSEDAFRRFKQEDIRAFNEREVLVDSLSVIDNYTGDLRGIGRDYLFNNLTHLTDGTLVAAKPDILYGARPEQLNYKVRDELHHSIVPSTQTDLPMAPNFFLEAKGPDGSPAVAMRQACYDGTIGARGIHALQSYKYQKPIYDENAYTISAIYQYGHLKLYSHHIAPPTKSNGRPEYIMTSLCSYSMVNNTEDFVKGASAYRNLRDWAKEKRDMFIKIANERYKGAQSRPAPEKPMEPQSFQNGFDTSSVPNNTAVQASFEHPIQSIEEAQ
ncbi:hypothetical protein FQN49_000176 [Arthroderma sp. PD_2]|nr:hypothetical protein FQN49_000176 [Arthroderma sp. PD_2]